MALAGIDRQLLATLNPGPSMALLGSTHEGVTITAAGNKKPAKPAGFLHCAIRLRRVAAAYFFGGTRS